MSSYTPHQYAEQRRIQDVIIRCNAEGVCPVCGGPQGVWPNGQRRMTCGQEVCYRRWLMARPQVATNEPPQGATIPVTFARGEAQGE